MPVSFIHFLQLSGVIVVNACNSNMLVSVVLPLSNSDCCSSNFTLENADSIGLKSRVRRVRRQIMHQTTNILKHSCYFIHMMNSTVVHDDNTMRILAIKWRQVGKHRVAVFGGSRIDGLWVDGSCDEHNPTSHWRCL